MIPQSPLARSRAAFCALAAALFLIATDRTLANQDLSPLYLFIPAIAVVATGQVQAREALVRAGFCVALVILTVVITNLAQGRDMPRVPDVGLLIYALSGIFALYLFVIVITSILIRQIWPASDHWTR